MNSAAIYKAGDEGFQFFSDAVKYAAARNLTVVQIDNGLTRWTPIPAKAAKRKVRHVIVNADGTETEFGKVRR